MRALLAAVFAAMVASAPAMAWSTRDCPTSSAHQPTYPGNSVWPLHFFSNMSSGSQSRVLVEGAMATWNAIVGANDNLTIGGNGYGYCSMPNNANRSVIGWDDGTCYSWGFGEQGVTQVWTSSCAIVRQEVYFNSNASLSGDELTYVALHELGHYQNAAHEWSLPAVMGYSGTPLPFLMADDHAFLRNVWSSGRTAAPDLYLNRFVARSPILPDQESIVVAPAPVCSGSCTNLKPQDSISVKLTYGNAGSQSVSGSFDIVMRLVPAAGAAKTVSTWTVSSYPAHSQTTYTFIGTMPAGIPPGTYRLEVEIDPTGRVAQSNGPTSGEVVSFTGFAVAAPAGWTCAASRYNALDGCDCECGVADPDCTTSPAVARGCGDSNACTDDRCDSAGHCVYSASTAACEDGAYCTVNDRCSGGACGAGAPRDCSAQTTFCSLATCVEAARACVGQPRNEGQSCDDGRFCTVSEACANGSCVGTARDCSSLSRACTTGTCDETGRRCVASPANQGGSCDDGLKCTTGDSCANGTCTGRPVDCSALNGPCVRGSCDAATGQCVAVAVADGTGCDDGQFCTQGEVCQAGVCGAGQPRSCAALDSACTKGSCDESADRCVASAINEGASCDDQQFCTVSDTCQAGRCSGAPLDCSALNGVCTVGRCDELGDRCVAAPANEGKACDDGVRCSEGDECRQGVCRGAAKRCQQPTSSCASAACDEGTGACVTTNRPDGTACNDENLCTARDQCVGGVCAGTSADCSPFDTQCNVGYCNPATGACGAKPRPEGTSCDDTMSCTVNDACNRDGRCVGKPRDCSFLDGLCQTGSCDPGTGQCIATPSSCRAPEPPKTGCGCGPGAGADLALALALLLVRRTRRTEDSCTGLQAAGTS